MTFCWYIIRTSVVSSLYRFFIVLCISSTLGWHCCCRVFFLALDVVFIALKRRYDPRRFIDHLNTGYIWTLNTMLKSDFFCNFVILCGILIACYRGLVLLIDERCTAIYSCFQINSLLCLKVLSLAMQSYVTYFYIMRYLIAMHV